MKTATIVTTYATRPNFRTNKDQVIDFFGHGLCNVKFMGTCPVSGIRMYDMPGAPFPDHDFTTLEAKDYGMSGPDFRLSYLASNDGKQAAQALEMAKATWLPGPDKVGPTLFVRILGLRWFDRANGNTYFSAVAIVNGEIVVKTKFEYGYESQYADSTARKLAKLGFLPGLQDMESASGYCQRNGITYSQEATDVPRRRDL